MNAELSTRTLFNQLFIPNYPIFVFMNTKIVFLGSKPIGYDCLQFLIENKDIFNIEISAVGTQTRKEFDPEKNLGLLAEQHGIPCLDSLDKLPECDIIYSVQHHQLLRQQHLDKAKRIAVNLHLAPLPEYRGCNQFSFAIIDEATEFGVSLHEIDTRIDHGDLLFQTRFPIPENCWVNELYGLTVQKGFQLFKDSLNDLIKGNYKKTPQQTLIKKYGGAIHFRNEINNLKIIDLGATKNEIEKRIRATYMPGFEPPYCLINGEQFYFKKA